MPAWFSRAQVREQLRALGYGDVSDATLDEFYEDLVEMARRDAVAGGAAHAAEETLAAAGPASASAATTVIQSDAQFDRAIADAPGDYVVGMFEELGQMSLDQKAKADEQRKRDASPELPINDIIDSASEPGLLDDDASLGGVQPFDEVLADPEYDPPAYIKPRAPPRRRKADPVSRGARYREEQKRFTIPGQNNHARLRREVRERMRENVDPPYVRPSHRPRKNDYVVPTEKKRAPLRWVVRQYTEHAR